MESTITSKGESSSSDDKLGHLLALRELKISQRKYADAKTLTAEIEKEVSDRRAAGISLEQARQARERSLLEKARFRAVSQEIGKKQKIIENASNAWERKIETLSEKQRQTADWAKTTLTEKSKRATIVLSGQVRDLKNAEQRLRVHKDFTESDMCKRKVDFLEEQELNKISTARLTQLDKAKHLVDQKHDLELSFVKAQMRCNIAMLNRVSDSNIKGVKQRFTNYASDMNAMHKAEVTALVKAPHFIQLKPGGSRPRHPHSSRGTQLTLLQQGRKQDQMPSLVSAYGHTLCCTDPKTLDDSEFSIRRRPE